MANDKIKRKQFATYLQAQGTKATYVLLGIDLEELLVEMNANVEKTTNILGTTSVTLDKYEKQSSVEPYKAVKGDELFTWLQSIVDEEKTLSEVETKVCHVKLWESETSGAYPATEEDVVIEVVSYGGDTTGYQIPFNIHYTGIRRQGTFNTNTKTFTEASASQVSEQNE